MINWKDLRMSTNVQDRFIYWIKCREEARLRKEIDSKPPYTRDPIIGNYKFCNVNREHDAVTIWVRENIREDGFICNMDTPHLMIMNLALARLLNHPETMVEAGLPVGTMEDVVTACQAAEKRKARGDKMLRGAYLVTPHGGKNKGVKTTDYIARIVGHLCDEIAPYGYYSNLKAVAEVMMEAYGWQGFMVNQICTDLRYTPWFEYAPDWETFVLAGPGTRRGVSRYNGATTKEDIQSVKGGQEYYTQQVLEVRDNLVTTKAGTLGAEVVKAFRDPNNVSNCFCEFDKFERARDAFINGTRITLKHYKK